MRKRITIGIAEDHDLVRHGITNMLNEVKEIKVLFSVKNGVELMQKLKEHNPSIILLDIRMPELNGVDAMRLIKEHFAGIKIIVFSSYGDELSILEYVKQGADSFLHKEVTFKTLLDAINTVYKHGVYFEKEVSAILSAKGAKPFIVKELTEREKKVLSLLVQNNSVKHIAKTMQISDNTVEWYRSKLILKTNSKDFEGLVEYAKERVLH
ncbi:MAG: response regulator transcription factor [Bacteroidia bacterium]|nr:response regulator transcription factor [Bacteroidia bacterium]